ncbi:MAG TPA: DNA internalization-related competence protein ComEC/Rec2, partial [Clostridiales bacterium]|nr:DNA internalization-related competence protein ComEC/Rec2 [Clostridiales bacterium]
QQYNNEFVEGVALIKNIKDKGDTVMLIAQATKINNNPIDVTVTMNCSKDDSLLPGDLIQFLGTLSIPTGQRNPGNFNELHYMASKKLSAKINYPKIDHVQKEYQKKPVIRSAIQLRRIIIERIEKLYPEKHAALLSGMTIGYTGGMDDTTLESFTLSGLSHIIAVSGAHVAFIMMPLLFLTKKLGLNIFVSNLLYLPVIIFYAFLTGLEASVVRATVMAGIGFMSTPLLRKSDTLNTLCVSCLILLLYNPFMVLGVGFILSYGATLGIILLLPHLRNLTVFKKLQGFVTDTFLCSLAATLSILPFCVKYFYMVTPYSLIANMLVIPFTGLITICGILSICLPLSLGKILSYPVIAMLEFAMRITGGISTLRGAKLLLNIPSIYQITIYYLILYCFLFKKGRSLKEKPLRVVLVSIALLFVINFSLFHRDQTTVTFIDVGQGDSIYIKTANNKVFLVDGGGSVTYDVGQNTVMPFLLSQHARKIDGMFSTHNDLDHIGGLVSVADNLIVKNAFLPYQYQYSNNNTVTSLMNNSKKVTFVHTGQTVIIDKDTSIKVLWPPITKEDSDDKNHLSLVLLFQYKDFKVLLTGDLDGEGVTGMMPYKQEMDCTVLKIPHHGGDNTRTEDLIQQSSPNLAIISVGRNKYGHPTQKVLDLLEQYDVPVLRTDDCGAITIKTNGKKYTISTAMD